MGTPCDASHDALALYPWSRTISWCLAEGNGNRDQRRPKAHRTPEGLIYILLYLYKSKRKRIFFSCCPRK